MASVLVPPFPLLGEPGAWDALTLLASSLHLEAEGEPWDGLLGVGWVLRRRALDWKLGWHAAMLGPEGRAYDDGKAWEPLSCWNDDYRSRAMARLSTATPEAAEPSWKAAAAALWGLLPDPVNGSTHYLNIELTKKIRQDHTLPSWFNENKVRAKIGRHAFLRAW